jgi:uncharacterized small protein (DUF1192 family)
MKGASHLFLKYLKKHQNLSKARTTMARPDDDDAPIGGKKKAFEPKPLEALSIAELEGYIVDLKGEILRTEAMIEAKRHVRAGADSLFGKKPS